MAAPSSSIEQAIHQTIVQAEQALAQAWDLVSSQSPSLHDLPNNLHSSLNDLYNKVTNNGSLPVPSWKDLPAAFTGAAEPLPPPPPPPPASSPASFLVHLTRRHPILLASVVTAGVTGGAYYFAPGATTLVLQRTVKPLKPFVPLALLPKTDRPARLISEQHGEVRKEAVLVLGAEGTAAELALDLEARGFIVIATVSHPSLVDALEKRSRGWMKVLVLDPTEVRCLLHLFHPLRAVLLTPSVIGPRNPVVQRRTLPSILFNGTVTSLPSPHFRRPLLAPVPRSRSHFPHQLPLAPVAQRQRDSVSDRGARRRAGASCVGRKGGDRSWSAQGSVAHLAVRRRTTWRARGSRAVALYV